MPLWKTLRRRGVPARGEFSQELRNAVVFDIYRLLFVTGLPYTVDRGDLLLQTQADMLQHVFAGVEPQGQHVTHSRGLQGREESVLRWALIGSYIKDAEQDICALDATSVVLRRLHRATHDFRDQFGDLSDWREALSIPDEVQFIVNVEDLFQTINERFRESDVGFQFVAEDVEDFVMSPEPLLHTEVVEPTLHALARHEELADTEKEYTRALDAWKKEDYKQAVDAAYESVEGMLRVIARLSGGSNFESRLIKQSVKALRGKNLWHPIIDQFMLSLAALRNALGGHSEGTKPPEARASAEDAATAVFISGALLVHISAVFERLLAENG